MNPSPCARRQGRPLSFVQELFGLLMQAPCPADYRDSSTPPTAPAPGPAPGSAVSGGSREGGPRTADAVQPWRRGSPLVASGRPVAQVGAHYLCHSFPPSKRILV